MTKYLKLILILTALSFSLNIAIAQEKKAEDNQKESEQSKKEEAKARKETKEFEKKTQLVQGLLTDIEKVEKSIALVKDEIDQTREKKYLPTLQLRLAELYVEKSRLIYYRLKEEASEEKRGSVESAEAREAKELAIETYKAIINDYPDFPENVKVHFFMAHELREIGNLGEMLKQYETIVEKYPKSKYRGEALIMLGDYHFDRKRIDRAAGYYKKIIDAKIKRDITQMARYKLAWCYLNQQNYRKALEQFEKIALLAKKQKIDTEALQDRLGKSTLVREALVDSILCFTEIKKPKEAIPYYKNLSDSELTYAKILEKLANRYYIKRNLEYSTLLYRELLQISGELEDNIEYLKRVLQYSRDFRSREQAIADIDFLIKNLNRYLHSFRVADEDKRLAYKQFEVFARDIATKLHLKADETKKAEYYDASAKAYKQYLTLFKDSKYAKDIQFNFAETLYASKKYLDAGEQYETIYQKTTNKKEKSDALYSAVSAYFDAIKDPKSLDKVQLIDARQGFLKTAKQYITEFPNSKKTRELRFAIGRTHYDLEEYDEAIQSFVKYINDYPKDKMSPQAARLVLDCYSTRKDFKGLVDQGKLFLANDKLRDKQLRSDISELVKKTEFVMIQEKAGKGKLKLEQGDFARDFMQYSAKYRGTDLGEKALYNAFQGYRKKRDTKHTYISGTQFIIQYPKSEFLSDVYPTLGTIAFETSNYDRAAYYFENFYRKFPKDRKAAELLQKAAKLRTALSDSPEAISDYQKLLASGLSVNMAAVYYDMALNYERMGNYKGVIDSLSQAKDFGKDTVDVNTKLAVAYYKMRNFRKTRQAIAQALKLASEKGSSGLTSSELSDVAHAKFLNLEMIFSNFNNIKLTGGKTNEAKLVERKNRYLQDMENALSEISNYKDPKWTIATIFRISQAYALFADFLSKTETPKNLNSAQKKQYRQILGQKIAALKKQSDDSRNTALSRAYTLNVFNNWVKSCYRGYFIPEKLKTRGYVTITAKDKKKIEELYVQLLSKPTNTKILNKIALLYMRNRDFGKAKTLFERSLEIRSRSSVTQNNLGVAEWYLGEDQSAYHKFSKAISMSPRNTKAKINLAAMLNDYGNKSQARASISKSKDISKVSLNAINVIPPARKLLRK